MITNHLKHGSKVMTMFWLAIALGSCTATQYKITNVKINNVPDDLQAVDLINGQIPNVGYSDVDCINFERTEYEDHIVPNRPDIDISRLSDRELALVLFDYADELKQYIKNDETYLQEDIINHHLKCTPYEQR